jgi:uncharacterized protein YbjT (DUF2867 family)
MTTRKALLAGATGLTGGYVLQALLDTPIYAEVIALVRKPLLKTHRKLREVSTNFKNLDQISSQLHADDVFCCLGTTIKKAGSQNAFRAIDYSLVIMIAEMMKMKGAEKFIVISAMGADIASKVFYNRVKGEMEETLKEIDYPCLCIVRPSLLLGPRQEFRLGEKIGVLLAPMLKPLMLGPLEKYRPVQAEAVGEFMVRVAQEENYGVKIYESNQILS